LLYVAVSGPSQAKAQSRRLGEIRERHSKASDVVAQAQMKKIFAHRETRIDGIFQRFIPNPALLKQRIEQTGREWTIAQYGMVSLALILVVASLIWMRGMPLLLSILVGAMVGVGLPHLVIGKLITRRIGQFNVRFPDAIELMVRGLRSGLPISETLGIVASE